VKGPVTLTAYPTPPTVTPAFVNLRAAGADEALTALRRWGTSGHTGRFQGRPVCPDPKVLLAPVLAVVTRARAHGFPVRPTGSWCA
jgi:hypothetical protein